MNLRQITILALCNNIVHRNDDKGTREKAKWGDNSYLGVARKPNWKKNSMNNKLEIKPAEWRRNHLTVDMWAMVKSLTRR